MVEATTWAAYIDQVPAVSVEGGTANEVFRRLVSQLHQGDCPGLPPGPLTITRVKLVRPALPQ